MNRVLASLIRIFTVALLCGVLLTFSSCTDSQGKEESVVPPEKPAVSDDGSVIRFSAGSPGLKILSTTVVHKGTVLLSVFAPARVVASAVPASNGGDAMLLFDSPDVASLYSQYRQSQSNVELTAKNLERVRDMFNSNAATGKDLNQAESDAVTARASAAEFEGKLRVLGFDPRGLTHIPAGSLCLMSDVPENQLHEVQQGEEVDVFFSAYPDRKFTGRADAIGDVVDPTTRTVRVRVSMKNSGGRIFPGMFARIDFGDPVSGVIILPASAVVTVEESDFVFVQDRPRTFQRRQVTLASSSGNSIVVLKGLEDGENVVTSGAMLLKGLSFGF